ncbi:Ca2+-binding RTX toxin-like protein [Nocardioides ginsengisegetis]|uniref:Ca2+-binding RTX toxin-like protein n=1 Tax=Nocardioides ginsengisegetis TaxID=661491 RepID=A0A7W3IXH0_9ACTN|nr:calcium-binding protein [Nocardioides ginsengisegetis]MBA8802299.1 Ca2+-binding RTX toxin-like protein [Nocardioides ginsengisegetis]
MVNRVLALALVTPAVVPAIVLAGTAAQATSTPTCHGHAATMVGTPGSDRIVGTDGPDVIVGLDGNDRIFGGPGDDIVCGGVGSDVLRGGDGDDALYGGLDLRRKVKQGGLTIVKGDLVDGGRGDDLLAPGAGARTGMLAFVRPNAVTFKHAAGPVRVDLAAGTATGAGEDTILGDGPLGVIGSAYDDVLLGSARPDFLVGGKGDDSVSGRGSSDVLLDGGGQGDDSLDGGRGVDVAFGFAGDDVVAGGPGGDILAPSSGSGSIVTGGAGADQVFLPAGLGAPSLLDGGAGLNLLEVISVSFGDKRPVVTADLGTETVSVVGTDHDGVTRAAGFDGAQLLGRARWNYVGTDLKDLVLAQGGPLNARTLGGDDEVYADRFDDVIDAGDGTDRVEGGGGDDTCLNYEQGECPAKADPGPFRTATRAAGVLTGGVFAAVPQLRHLLAARHLR